MLLFLATACRFMKWLTFIILENDQDVDVIKNKFKKINQQKKNPNTK